PTVRVRTGRVNALLGTSLTRDEVAGLLEPIGYRSTPVGDDDLDVAVPSWRPDSSIEADVVEEVARHHGYDRLPREVPVSPHTGELSPAQRDRRVLRRTLMAQGLDEAMPMPFLAPGDLERCGLPPDGLRLANPLAAEESVLRTSLLPGLLDAVAYNASHRNTGVRLFEVGRVFSLGDEGVITDVERSVAAGRVLSGEREHLAAVLAGCEAPAAVELLEVALGAVGRRVSTLHAAEIPGLHPGRAAQVEVRRRHGRRGGPRGPRAPRDRGARRVAAARPRRPRGAAGRGAPPPTRQPPALHRFRPGLHGARGGPRGRRRRHDPRGRRPAG